MKVRNYINNEWIEPKVSEYAEVINPATGKVIAKTPLCGEGEVDLATKAAAAAFPAWRKTPVQDRIQYFFKLRDLLKANHDEIGRIITEECGKTFAESTGCGTRDGRRHGRKALRRQFPESFPDPPVKSMD